MSVPAAPLELDGFGIGYTYIITYVFGHIRRIYLIYSPLIPLITMANMKIQKPKFVWFVRF